jgi:hypothetical protein
MSSRQGVRSKQSRRMASSSLCSSRMVRQSPRSLRIPGAIVASFAPYHFTDDQLRVVLEPSWRQFFKDHYCVLMGNTRYQLIQERRHAYLHTMSSL